jgi:hypothetical protein
MNETLSFFELDTSNPIHTKAYLKAASFYLSGWPQEWSAEELAMALLSAEDPNADYYESQFQIRLWEPIKKIAAGEDSDPYLLTDRMISDLAEEFVNFLDEAQTEN